MKDLERDEKIKKRTRKRDLNPKRMMQARICHFVSKHQDILIYDSSTYSDIEQMEKIDIETEAFTKEITYFKSYGEVKVCSKISTTNWDDSFNLTWELI